MKFRTFFILITGSLLLMNCGGTRGEGIVGEVIQVNGELPEETESIDLFLDYQQPAGCQQTIHENS